MKSFAHVEIKKLSNILISCTITNKIHAKYFLFEVRYEENAMKNIVHLRLELLM
jgi:hypothetical protein